MFGHVVGDCRQVTERPIRYSVFAAKNSVAVHSTGTLGILAASCMRIGLAFRLDERAGDATR